MKLGRRIFVGPWWTEWPWSFEAKRGSLKFRTEVFFSGPNCLIIAERRDHERGPLRQCARATVFGEKDRKEMRRPPKEARESLRRGAGRWADYERVLLYDMLMEDKTS